MGNEGDNVNKALLDIINRLENLNQEKQGLAEDIKEVRVQAKAEGFDLGMIGEMLKLRKMDKEDRQAREELRDRYVTALDLI